MYIIVFPSLFFPERNLNEILRKQFNIILIAYVGHAQKHTLNNMKLVYIYIHIYISLF